MVEEAVVENKLVVVAEVPVALVKVKFCKVLEAVTKILAKVGLAVVFTDWSNQSLSVGAPFTVKLWPFTESTEVKRLVLDAVLEKKLVVVAEVPVAVLKVNDWRVVEALARMLVKVPVVPEMLPVNVPETVPPVIVGLVSIGLMNV